MSCLQFTWIAAGVLTLVFCVIWPVMTIPAGVFSLGYFYWFVILSLCWGLIAAVIAIFLPLWESRDVFARVAGMQDTLPRDAKLPHVGKPEGQFKTAPGTDDTAHELKA